MSSSRSVSVTKLIHAPASTIFDLLADPRQHVLLDGSGSVSSVKHAPERLTLGSTFSMHMKIGLGYVTRNRVVEFEENRRIAWQTGPKGKLEPYVAGRIWRYELEPRGDRTLVRESWDISTDHQRVLLKLGDIYSKKTRRDMELTLARLDALVTAQER